MADRMPPPEQQIAHSPVGSCPRSGSADGVASWGTVAGGWVTVSPSPLRCSDSPTGAVGLSVIGADACCLAGERASVLTVAGWTPAAVLLDSGGFMPTFPHSS